MIEQKLIHAQDIAEIAQCPPQQKDSSWYGQVVYRLVPKLVVDKQCFLTPMQVQPSRVFKSKQKECSAHALSFFISVQHIKSHRNALRNVANGKILKAIGDKIAQCVISPDDGHLCMPDSKGHFDLHPYESIGVHSLAVVIQETD